MPILGMISQSGSVRHSLQHVLCMWSEVVAANLVDGFMVAKKNEYSEFGLSGILVESRWNQDEYLKYNFVEVSNRTCEFRRADLE